MQLHPGANHSSSELEWLSVAWQVSSGIQPAQESQVGSMNRWPETLAIILANPSQGGHKERVAAMGRKLQNNCKLIAAAHTCYLMAEVGPQPHDCKVAMV